MKNKNNVIITISLIGLMFTIFIGLSFAFFTSNLEGTESESTIITSSGTLSISYAEGDGSISIGNVYPREEAWLTKTFTLTGNNTTNLNMNYSVSLSIEENGFSSGDLTYSLTSEEASSGTVIEDKTDKSIGGVGNQTIGYGQFVKGTGITHTYTLSIYFKDNGKNQNASQGAVFSGKIVVNEAGTGDIPIIPPDGWENASSGTLLAGIKSNYSTATSTLTTPGQAISTSYEAVMSSSEDDYGTSYYFRGAVENNYVVFASMCWRIVRITGDGSIKLTLYNYNSDKENTETPCSATDTSLAFARYSGTTYTSAFNSSYDPNKYIGFMYGTTSTSSYAVEHENLYDSTILTNLKKWYDANFNDAEQSLLADTIWCNDKRLSSGSGYSTNKSYYAASGRLSTVASASPSLKCGDTKDDNKISKFTASDTVYGNGKLRGTNGAGDKEYKIGLLTADEVAYAGGIYGTANSTYYLYKNASSNAWWSLSPHSAGSYGFSFVCYVDSAWTLSNRSVNDTNGVRPAISLVSTASITGGDGSSTNPFVIDENI
jgi:hypothetical protein